MGQQVKVYRQLQFYLGGAKKVEFSVNSSGNVEIKDVSGNIIGTLDAANRKLIIPSGAVIDVSAATGSISLAAGEIDTADLASNAVTTIKITDANVTTAKIADAAINADKLADAIGNYVAYPKTTAGIQDLLAAATKARACIIHLKVTESFAAGDGAAPIFKIGDEITDDKFLAAKNTGAAGDLITVGGEIAAAKKLIVTATAATGTTSTGAIEVTAIAV